MHAHWKSSMIFIGGNLRQISFAKGGDQRDGKGVMPLCLVVGGRRI